MVAPATKLAALDLWPLAKKLSRDEQLQLARLLLQGSLDARGDAAAYAASAPTAEEFGSDENSLAWEGDGWEEFYEKG